MVVSAYAPIGSPGRIWYNEGEPHLLEEAIVKELATKYNKSGAQVRSYIHSQISLHLVLVQNDNNMLAKVRTEVTNQK